MPEYVQTHGTEAVLPAEGLGDLIQALDRRGYAVIAPAVREAAIDWSTVDGAEDLPRGKTAKQAPGVYRLEAREDGAYFSYANGLSGLKRFLHQPEVRLLSVESNGNPFHILENQDAAAKRAFIGVRACDIAALRALDRVLIEDRYPDALYERNRKEVFIVAVSCTEPSSSCFCASMGAGPEVTSGFDLLLTELVSESPPCFLVAAGSERGEEILAELGAGEVTGQLRTAAREAIAAGRERITRRLDASAVRNKLWERFDHPEWERVAARCFGCGNCTQVCPTCFCITVDDTSDIDGKRAERWRKWDSCFTLGYSYIHGGSVRQSAKARYRQWATHKFAAWYEQFGMPGCCGCGRCITWCPAGIDLTEVLGVVAGSE